MRLLYGDDTIIQINNGFKALHYQEVLYERL